MAKFSRLYTKEAKQPKQLTESVLDKSNVTDEFDSGGSGYDAHKATVKKTASGYKVEHHANFVKTASDKHFTSADHNTGDKGAHEAAVKHASAHIATMKESMEFTPHGGVTKPVPVPADNTTVPATPPVGHVEHPAPGLSEPKTVVNEVPKALFTEAQITALVDALRSLKG